MLTTQNQFNSAGPNTGMQGQAEGGINIDDLIQKISQNVDATLTNKLGEFKNPQMTQEQIELNNEKIREEFAENPSAFMEKMSKIAEENAFKKIQTEISPKIENIMNLEGKMKWREEVNRFLTQNPQATQYMPQMQQVLSENQTLMNTSNPLEVAYKMVAANQFVGDGGDVVDNILANEELSSKFLQNPKLKEAIIKQYQDSLNGINSNNIPPLMGNQGGGQGAPISGGTAPRNLKEARQSALRRLGM